MSEQHENPQQAFRLIVVVIGVILISILLLIAVVFVYRMGPGRHFPYVQSSPSAPAQTPAAG
jgi:hypothetical protein